MYKYFLLSRENKKKVIRYLICVFNSQKRLTASEWREECSDWDYPDWNQSTKGVNDNEIQ